jgi:hypothetical protein
MASLAEQLWDLFELEITDRAKIEQSLEILRSASHKVSESILVSLISTKEWQNVSIADEWMETMSLPELELWILFYSGRESINYYRRLVHHDWLVKLKYQMDSGPALVHLKLAYALMRVEEVALDVLVQFDAPFIAHLLKTLENSYTDDAYTTGIMSLLASLFHQYEQRPTLDSAILGVLAIPEFKSRQISESLIFVLNRAG